MPSVTIENGKRIPELLEITTYSSKAMFLVCDNNLTRRTTLENLRNMFRADNSTTNKNNLFYSAEKMDQLFENITSTIKNLSNRVDNIDKNTQNVYTTISSDLDNLKSRLDQMYAELTQADETIYNYINNTVVKKIDAVSNDLAAKYKELTDYDKTLNDKIQSLSTKVGNMNALREEIAADTIVGTINNAYHQFMSVKTKLDNLINVTVPSLKDADTNLGKRINNVTMELTSFKETYNNDLIYIGNEVSKIADIITRVNNVEKNINNIYEEISDYQHITISSSAPSTLYAGHIHLQTF